MERISHGTLLLDHSAAKPLHPAAANANSVVPCPERTRFDYLFPFLQKDPNGHLPDVGLNGVPTAQTLIWLGNAMTDPDSPGTSPSDPRFDSAIPSLYTYFGQFITHEVVFEVAFKDRKLGLDTLPLNEEEISQLQNARTTLMDLDSVYGPMLDKHNQCAPVPVKEDKMVLGIAGNGQKFRGFDLLREVDFPFTAFIGDRRNDSNLITSQLHLAFLRAHNALMEEHKSFPDVQKLLRQHFQWLVLEDYLPRVVDENVLRSVRNGEIDLFKDLKHRSFMPIEFSAAAFRFAHSMPRSRYDYNRLHPSVSLFELFLPIPQYSRILEEWIIEWERFIGFAPGSDPDHHNFARLIDTRLVQPLFRIIDSDGKRVVDSQNRSISLAALDLLRGYLLRLPTGQKVAEALNETPLSAAEIEEAAGRIVQDETSLSQQKILRASGLSERTPLWFYILAEAAVQKDGACLGRVGSKLVAGVLVELVRRSSDSILDKPNWAPTLNPLNNGTFNLVDLLKLAKVVPNPNPKKEKKDNGN